MAPGPVRGHCPPVREIIVAETKKVYDFCFQEELIERCFFIPDVQTGATVIACNLREVWCQEVGEREYLPEGDGLALINIQIRLTIDITLIPAPAAQPIVVTRQIVFPKRVVLCAPPGTDVTCDVRGTCICTIQPPADEPPTAPPGLPVTGEPNICCTIQLCIVSFVDGGGSVSGDELVRSGPSVRPVSRAR